MKFRDMTGKISVSIPTRREPDAYPAAMVFGVDLPSDISPNGQSAEIILASSPGLSPFERCTDRLC